MPVYGFKPDPTADAKVHKFAEPAEQAHLWPGQHVTEQAQPDLAAAIDLAAYETKPPAAAAGQDVHFGSTSVAPDSLDALLAVERAKFDAIVAPLVAVENGSKKKAVRVKA